MCLCKNRHLWARKAGMHSLSVWFGSLSMLILLYPASGPPKNMMVLVKAFAVLVVLKFLVHVEVVVLCSRRQFLHPRNIFYQRLHVARWLFGLAVPLALDGGHINGHKSRSFFVGYQDLIIWITRPCVGLLCERDGHACKHIERAGSPS